MSKVTPPINNLNAGEMNPLLDARTDFAKYASGCRTLENAMPLVEGGAKKMPGTNMVVISSNGKARLAPFSFSTDQSYVIEFSNKKIRIFTADGGLLETPAAGPTPAAYDPAHTYSAGDQVSVGNTWFLYFQDFKVLFVTLPVGITGIGTSMYITYGSTDVLSANIYGQAPYAGIQVTLANATAAKNTAALIQTAIRALGSVNGYDISHVTVTANAAYAAAPPIFDGASAYPTNINQWMATNSFQAVTGANLGNFPVGGSQPGGGLDVTNWTMELTPQPLIPLEIVSPYLEADVFDLDVGTQSADTLYIFHHLYPTMLLQRQSASVWTLTEASFLGTPDVSKTGYNKITRIISGITNASPAVITANLHGLIVGNTIYINHVLGMLDLNQGQFLVKTVPNGNTFTIADLNNNAIDSTNFGAYTDGGWVVKLIPLFNAPGVYPGCGTFFEQRLCLGGFDNYPERIQGSVSGDFYNFTSDPDLDDYAFQFDLVSQKVDPIRWFVAQQQIAAGTDSGVWVIGGPNDTPLTQTNVKSKKQITIGAGKVAPQIVNESIVWLTRVVRIVRLLQYVWQQDQWIAPDLTRIARHITVGASAAESGIVQTAYQSEPYPIFWAVRKDGQLIGMTFESQEQVYAWFRIVTDGFFESVAVVPRNNDEDRVFVVVRR